MCERLSTLEKRRLSGSRAMKSVADGHSRRDLVDGAKGHVQCWRISVVHR